MKVHVQPEQGKVVISSTCTGCSNGLHDILRPCPVCKLDVLGKRNLRAALYGSSATLDAVVFGAPLPGAVRP